MLARNAVFDLNPALRKIAQAALAKRPREEYQQVLLNGLRYPWPAVAEHAAEALVALGRREAVPDLVRLLDQPSPAAPIRRRASQSASSARWCVSIICTTACSAMHRR